MKKMYFLFFVLLCLGLTACGTKESLNKKEVLEKASEAVETLKSYTVDMNYKTNAMDMDMTMKGTGDITHNPDAMHFNMSMTFPGMSMDYEMYIKEKEAYMSMFGEWVRLDSEELGIESFDQLNKEEMEKLERFSDDFKMTEKNDQYVLTLSAKGDQYNELVRSLVESSMEDFTGESETAIEDIKVNSINMEIHIDKKSFFMTKQKVKADLVVDGEKMTLDGEFKISNINKVQPIEIPQEVKDNAVEMDESFGMGETMTIEEIQGEVDYTIPQVTKLPEGYSYLDSYYDESMDIVTINYEKDIDHSFSLSIYPSADVYGEVIEDETTTSVKVNGKDGVLSASEDFFILTWEQGDGLFLELYGYDPDLTNEKIIEIAESIK